MRGSGQLDVLPNMNALVTRSFGDSAGALGSPHRRLLSGHLNMSMSSDECEHHENGSPSHAQCAPPGSHRLPLFPVDSEELSDILFPSSDVERAKPPHGQPGRPRPRSPSLPDMRVERLSGGSSSATGSQSSALADARASPQSPLHAAASLHRVDSCPPPTEKGGSLELGKSVNSGPARFRTGGHGCRPGGASPSRVESTGVLTAVIMGSLDEGNMDRFLAAYAKLRMLKGDGLGSHAEGEGDPTDLRARAVLQEAAAKMERAFREVLETQTRVVDAKQLIEFRSNSLELSDRTAVGGADRFVSPPHPLLSVAQEDFPGFQFSDTSGGGPEGEEMTPRVGLAAQGYGGMPLVPDDCAEQATGSSPSGGSRDSHFCKSSTSSLDTGPLPLFPTDDGLEDDREERFSSGSASPPLAFVPKPLVQASLAAWCTSTGTAGSVAPEPEVEAPPGAASEELFGEDDTCLVSPDAVARLQRLANGLIASGLEKTCLRVYTEVRGAKLQASLGELEIGPVGVEEAAGLTVVKADERIKRWKHQLEVAVHAVMMPELKLCGLCFASNPSSPAPWLADEAFHSLAQIVLKLLFPVAHALAGGLRSEAKLMLLLDLYEALVGLMPVLEEIFTVDTCSDLRIEARNALDKVTKAVKNGFRQFEEFIATHAVEPVPANASVPERGLVVYVMRILHVLSGYKETLKQIFKDTQFREALEPILSALQKAVPRQAKQFQDPAQEEFFLMNNTRFVTLKIKSLGLRDVLGNEWVSRRNRQVAQHSQAYYSRAWAPVATLLAPSALTSSGSSDASLPWDGSADGSPHGGHVGLRRMFLGSSHRGGGSPGARDRLEEFSQAFARVYWRHRSWLIPDDELRNSQQHKLAFHLLEVYRPAFQAAYSSRAGRLRGFGSRLRQGSVVFTDKAINLLVRELFTGKPWVFQEVPFEELVRSANEEAAKACDTG